jgi:SagB-type dehydrogenase family enzyme
VNGSCFVYHPNKQKSFDLRLLQNKKLKKLMKFLQKPKSKADAHAFVATMLNIGPQEAVSHVQVLKDFGFIADASKKEIISWQENNWCEAKILHEHTVNTPRVLYNRKEGNAYDVALMQQYVELQAPPANYKVCEGEKVVLKKPDPDKKISLKSILDHKRKYEKIDKEKLARLLYFSFGKTGDRYMQVTGKHIRKTVPSGGARHPYEFYILIHDVLGLESGIYHYQFNDHYLSLLQKLERDKIKQLIDETLIIDPKRLCFSPQLAVVYSCVFERSMHRYRYSRSYKVMHYDLGHIYQNLEFLARAYGLNMYSGYSCHEKQIEEAIGIDSIKESCMGYAVL